MLITGGSLQSPVRILEITFFYFEVAFLGFLEMGASSSGNENADHVTGYANEYANEPEDSHPIFWLL